MDGDDSDLVFDFESTLDAAAAAGSQSVVVGAAPTSASASASHGLAPAAAGAGPHHGQGRGNIRQTVCRYWLRGLCVKEDSCLYLHQYDLDRMPVCQFYRDYGCCGAEDCVFKHDAEVVKECTIDLVFDFEDTLDAAGAGAGSQSVVVGAAPTSASTSASASDGLAPAAAGPHHGQGRGNIRRTVCRYWLRALCVKGDSCLYLHQYDLDRMPVCQFYRDYGCCSADDCVFKHNVEVVKECTMYNMGFCPNGPHCRYRHVKKPGPPPPVEEAIKMLQQIKSLNYGSSSGSCQPSDNNNNQQKKPQVQHVSVLKNHSLAANATPVVQQPAAHHVQTANQHHVPPPHMQQGQEQNAQVQGVLNGSSDQATITPSPLPHGPSRYSVAKSCNLENLEISVQQGVWASPKGVMMSFLYFHL